MNASKLSERVKKLEAATTPPAGPQTWKEFVEQALSGELPDAAWNEFIKNRGLDNDTENESQEAGR